MKKKIIDNLYIFLSFILFIIIFYKLNTIKDIILNNSINYIKNIFPILFISNIIINILNDSILIRIIYKYTNNIYIYIFLLSILSGTPFNSLILKDFLDKGLITKKDIEYIICFTTINNPLFIYTYIKLISNNYLYIIIFLYSFNLLLFVFLYKNLSKKQLNIVINNRISLSTSIKKAIISQLYIYASIIFFSLLADLLIKDINSITCLLKGLLELTKGLNCLVNISNQTKIKELFLLIILLFNGLSIHIQISNNLPKDINYNKFYITKLISILIAFIVFILV